MAKPALALARKPDPDPLPLDDEEQDPETYEREVRVLLLHALGQTAYVLRSYPPALEAQPANLAGALAWMRGQGLIQGSQRDPNLTEKGRELAERLREQQSLSAQGASVAR